MAKIPLSPEERQARLTAEVERYVVKGWHVVHRTDISVSLARPYPINWLFFVVLFVCTFAVGALIYAIITATRPRSLNLTVDVYGKVRRGSI